jgi:hypothetical protein
MFDMGLSYSHDGDVITIVADGEFDLEQVRATFSEIQSTFDQSSPLKILIDDPGSSFEPDTRTVQRLVDLWASFSGGAPPRIALLPARSFHYGRGRMVDALAEGREFDFAVFAEREEALAWLLETASQDGSNTDAPPNTDAPKEREAQ